MAISPIEEIKNRLDIVDVIQSYLKIQKAGINYRAVCPFHSEKKPSFFISPTRQIWHCFGCGSGSNIFDFIMKIEGVEFGDALRILARKAGVELQRQDPKLKSERQRLYEICELSCRFFEKQLSESAAGKEAKQYLVLRGISEEAIKKWRLGYSPESWQGLSDFLVGKGYKREEVEKAGLAVKDEKGHFYDRFRGRIIFPVFDLNSQVVGFGGRVFKEKDKAEVAKYVNTPNTFLYDKSRILYGLDRAKVEIRKKQQCVLVEGYTDVILSHLAGFENAVSVSGTALTPFQLRILKRYTDNLLTSFDMDVAGDSATKRGVDLAQGFGFNIKVVMMPEGLDPADVIKKDPGLWENLILQAKSIYDFYFESAFARFDPEKPEGKKEISKILLPVIKRIPNQIEKGFWIQKLAKELKIKEEDIREEMKKTKQEQEIYPVRNGISNGVYGLESQEIVNLPQKSRKELLEERFLMMLCLERKKIDLIEKEDFLFFSPRAREIMEFLKNYPEPEKDEEVNNFQNSLPPETNDFLNYIFLKAETEAEELNPDEQNKEFENCLREIKSLEIKDKLEKISQEIKKSEEDKNSPQIQELLQEFDFYSKSLQNLLT